MVQISVNGKNVGGEISMKAGDYFGEKANTNNVSRKGVLGNAEFVKGDNKVTVTMTELNENKNHKIIIKALAKLNNPNVHYAIAGIGEKRDYLLSLADELGVAERVHLLGYRTDIAELNHSSDVFCFPSFREGLGLAAVEAMACGVPLITSNVHGINDYSENGATGYSNSPYDHNAFAENINKLVNDETFRKSIGQRNKEIAKKYDIHQINSLMKHVYEL